MVDGPVDCGLFARLGAHVRPGAKPSRSGSLTLPRNSRGEAVGAAQGVVAYRILQHHGQGDRLLLAVGVCTRKTTRQAACEEKRRPTGQTAERRKLQFHRQIGIDEAQRRDRIFADHLDPLDPRQVWSARGLQQPRYVAGLHNEPQRDLAVAKRVEQLPRVNCPSQPISMLPVPMPPKCIRASLIARAIDPCGRGLHERLLPAGHILGGRLQFAAIGPSRSVASPPWPAPAPPP